VVHAEDTPVTLRAVVHSRGLLGIALVTESVEFVNEQLGFKLIEGDFNGGHGAFTPTAETVDRLGLTMRSD